MLKVKLFANVSIGRAALYPLPPELITLLRAIRAHGSLVGAIGEARMSHRKALALIKRWEAISGHKIALLARGQGTGLTEFGARLAQIDDWIGARAEERLAGLGGELSGYLDIPVADARQRVRMRASNDIAVLKLKERLDRHLAIDLQFEGSLKSLDSLARGDCDIAGFHLPDPPSLLGPLLGEFRSRLHSREHSVRLLVSRHQGLMVAKNARTRIRGMADLTKAGVRFVNRERGSGTRLLVDALLAHAGISATQVGGYEHEEFTHMATAATVRAGAADAAFGIEAAARAHGLAFVPLVTEHYYLACRRRSPARIALDTILASAGSPAFIRALARMGGYESTRTGSAVDLSELFTRPDET